MKENDVQCADPHQVETFGPLENTLTERGSRYGSFDSQANLTQDLKRVMQSRKGWPALDDDQKEALEMIAHKIGRILNGDPNYADSWHDIAGYAKLVDDRLAKKDEPLEIPAFLRQQDPTVDRRGPHHPGKIDTCQRRRSTDF